MIRCRGQNSDSRNGKKTAIRNAVRELTTRRFDVIRGAGPCNIRPAAGAVSIDRGRRPSDDRCKPRESPTRAVLLPGALQERRKRSADEVREMTNEARTKRGKVVKRQAFRFGILHG